MFTSRFFTLLAGICFILPSLQGSANKKAQVEKPSALVHQTGAGARAAASSVGVRAAGREASSDSLSDLSGDEDAVSAEFQAMLMNIKLNASTGGSAAGESGSRLASEVLVWGLDERKTDGVVFADLVSGDDWKSGTAEESAAAPARRMSPVETQKEVEDWFSLEEGSITSPALRLTKNGKSYIVETRSTITYIDPTFYSVVRSSNNKVTITPQIKISKK